MHAIEFVTELSPSPVLSVPKEAAAQLPKSSKARVIVLTTNDADDDEWRQAGYEQFMREDAPEDFVYDKCQSGIGKTGKQVPRETSPNGRANAA